MRVDSVRLCERQALRRQPSWWGAPEWAGILARGGGGVQVPFQPALPGLTVCCSCLAEASASAGEANPRSCGRPPARAPSATAAAAARRRLTTRSLMQVAGTGGGGRKALRWGKRRS